MHPLPILAVAGKADTSIMDALPHLAGMLMVMITLAILWGVCVITAKLVQTFLPAAAAVPVEKPTPQPPSPAVAPPAAGTPPEIVAVIAAAVAACTGGKSRIVSIKPMSTSWEKAGRQSVLTSHRIR